MSLKTHQNGSAVRPGLAVASLADADYDFLCQLIYERSRIHLGPDKRILITSRLARRLWHHGFTHYREYCEFLRSPDGATELPFLIDLISTNHTHCFREVKHFDFLRDVVIPQWRTQTRRTRPFRIWSAASSTGEEAYSIAIHLAEHFAPAAAGRWHIEGTDISTRVLKVAERGIYKADRLKGISEEILRRHFQRGANRWTGHFRVKAEVRRCVNFQHSNLLDAEYPFARPFDLIFCRNVMIYFDGATQETLVGKLSAQLVSGGYLLVGHSESLSRVKHGLKLVRPATYLKPVDEHT